MTRSKKKFYAVAEGECEPTIFSSWPKTQAVTSGHPRAKFKGFLTIEKAINFLHEHECFTFKCDVDQADWDGLPTSSGDCSYGVARGRESGIYTSYRRDVEPKVSKFPHTCHKAFRNHDAAQKANKDGKVMQDVVKFTKEARRMMSIMIN